MADVLKAHPKLVIVAAAGNENFNQVAFPAAYPGVVAVGATNILGNRAPYSNYDNSGLRFSEVHRVEALLPFAPTLRVYFIRLKSAIRRIGIEESGI